MTIIQIDVRTLPIIEAALEQAANINKGKGFIMAEQNMRTALKEVRRAVEFNVKTTPQRKAKFDV